MPITKTTDTVAGVDNVALLSLTQYGIRAKIEIPGKQAIAATHRASSGNNRTITLAEDHGMQVNDLFLFGGFANANYNPTTSYRIGNVLAVPAPNKLTYALTTSLTEPEVPDTTGGIVRLGFRTLRLGVRWAAPRSSSWSAGTFAHGVGLSQGTYPVGSPYCAAFFGGGGDDTTAARTYYPGPPAYTITGTSAYTLFYKRGAAWGSVLSGGTWRTAASRNSPFIRLLDLTVGSLTSSAPYFRVADFYTANQTRDMLLTTLRNPVPLGSGTFAGYTVGLAYAGTTDTPWAEYSAGADLYLEAFIRDPAQALEIIDIGYAYFA